MLASFLRSKRYARPLYVSLNEQTASVLNALSVAQLTTDQRLEEAGDSSERTFYLTNFIVTLTETASDRLFRLPLEINLRRVRLHLHFLSLHNMRLGVRLGVPPDDNELTVDCARSFEARITNRVTRNAYFCTTRRYVRDGILFARATSAANRSFPAAHERESSFLRRHAFLSRHDGDVYSDEKITGLPCPRLCPI